MKPRLILLRLAALTLGVWLLGFPGAGPVRAQESNQALIASQFWWIDPSGTASFEEVMSSADWTPFTGAKSFGFGPEAIWVRVRLKAVDKPTKTPWVVRIDPAFTDDLTLYDPEHQLQLRAGRAMPPDDDSLSTLSFSFQIPTQSTERDIFIRQTSVSSRSLRIEILPAAEAARLNRISEWLLGAAVMLSFVFAAWASLQWLIGREPVIGAFAVKQFVAFLFSFFFLGFARLSIGNLVPAGTLTWIGSILAVYIAATTAWFLATLLRPYRPWPALLKALRWLGLAYAFTPMLMVAGYPREMLMLMNASVPLGLLLVLITALSALRARSDQPIPITWLVGYLFVYGGLHLVPIFIHLGLISGSYSIMIGTVTTAIFDGIVMFFALQVRARELRKRQHATELELSITREQASAEKRLREEQGRLFAMLAHEMKTPLATLRLWMDAGLPRHDAIDKTITDMNKIIERCVQTGQLADQQLRPHLQSLDIGELTETCVASCQNPDRVMFCSANQTAISRTDAQILSIVLANLLDNACKYSEPGSPIQIELNPSERMGVAGWVWRIENQTGVAGLPDTSRLFEKYYRSPHARRQAGSGLGLFLVRGLLDLLHGSISYQAQPNRAVFSVWLPATPPAVGNRWG